MMSPPYNTMSLAIRTRQRSESPPDEELSKHDAPFEEETDTRGTPDNKGRNITAMAAPAPQRLMDIDSEGFSMEMMLGAMKYDPKRQVSQADRIAVELEMQRRKAALSKKRSEVVPQQEDSDKGDGAEAQADALSTEKKEDKGKGIVMNEDEA
ncbi:unnamed protein product [Discula destructiva]